MLALSKLEFQLLNTLIRLDESLNTMHSTILFNIQVSGGKDSMCLLHSFHAALNFKKHPLKNRFIVVAQHFNHGMRNKESQEDARFVETSCLKLGVPIYSQKLVYPPKKKNFQNCARDIRKQEALKLCQRLACELDCTKYFVVTAHHARDHVETVLMHILRGSGMNGLKGIQMFDDSRVFFRPFAETPYGDIEKNCQWRHIEFRQDSSNETDVYTRNYVRRHILPHFDHINVKYEQAFLRLSSAGRQRFDLQS